MAKSEIHWMEPRDLQFDDMSFQINDDAHPSIRSVHSGVANVSMLDGSVRALSDDTDPKLVKGSLTIAGGDPGLPWD